MALLVSSSTLTSLITSTVNLSSTIVVFNSNGLEVRRRLCFMPSLRELILRRDEDEELLVVIESPVVS
ncbi:unnamed protein product [Schistosoma margrebowiei]|uniref:Uncharacterized protein n=1 Tax=Schistosoma margrebowiei TaxID=48269 RepID=A0A183LHE7_9TREM|nr:unnamed protein product [Schistosoma margrebowiei]